MGNSPGTGEFPAQRASYAENVSIWWRHHEYYIITSQATTSRVLSCISEYPIEYLHMASCVLFVVFFAVFIWFDYQYPSWLLQCHRIILTIAIVLALIRTYRHIDEIFVTGCNGSCQNSNFQCTKWRQIRQYDNVFVSTRVSKSKHKDVHKIGLYQNKTRHDKAQTVGTILGMSCMVLGIKAGSSFYKQHIVA